MELNPKSSFDAYRPEGVSLEIPTLWSLWDMLRFYAATFMSVTSNLERVRATLTVIDTFLAGKVKDSQIAGEWSQLTHTLDGLRAEIEKMPLPVSLKGQIERAQERAKVQSIENVRVMKTIIEELQNNLCQEMADQLFFQVPANLKWFYLTPERWLGDECESKFPDIIKDAHDGLRCYVVDQWTASVFHCMRVLEHGLRWLCREVNIDNPDMDLENWKNIIDQIEKKIRQMESLPKGREKTENLQFYSEAAAQFRYFKDAWRNHVAHARINYDAKDAYRVLTHVADFMRQLSTKSGG